MTFFAGNTALNKLSLSSIRAGGLCADHFSDAAFTNPTKVRLLRNAIPIPFNSNSSSNNVDTQDQQIEMVQFPLNVNNETLEEQMSRESVIRTYRPSTLHFDMSAKEEDVMQWINLEPPVRDNGRR